jgi:putative transposase
MVYLWRRLSETQRAEVLADRQKSRRPWRRPPHFDQGNTFYHLTAACYEHRDWIGHSPQRMEDFCRALLDVFENHPSGESPVAWCVLPNHYHVLAKTADLKSLVSALAKLHGRTSFLWNKEEECRGRKVWHGVADRAMRTDGHFWATVNYIHHNPVKHGYVEKWDEWPYSSAEDYLRGIGREEAAEIWKSYPVLDYGKGWDD